MNEKLVVALADCLERMAQGTELEACLGRYPEFAQELRPLLLAAIDAGTLAAGEVPPDRLSRSRAKFLIAASEIRERKSVRKAGTAFPFRRPLRYGMIALVVIVLMAGIGGTGLVRASNVSLPGDQLYPIKLTWENLQLKLAVVPSERKNLENRFEQERVKEINNLISVGRSEPVNFSGQVQGVLPDQLIVSGVTVSLMPSTHVDGNIQLNGWVRVEGLTQSNGVVLAKTIMVIPAGAGTGGLRQNENTSTPSSGDSAFKGDENSNGDATGKRGPKKGGSPNGSETPKPDSTRIPRTENPNSGNDQNGQSTPEPQSFEIEGTVTSINGNLIVVGDKTISITPDTELNGFPAEGSTVKVRGFVNQDGMLIAFQVELKSDSGSNGGGGRGGEGGGDGRGGQGGGGDGPTRTPNPTETPDH